MGLLEGDTVIQLFIDGMSLCVIASNYLSCSLQQILVTILAIA